MKLNWSTFFKRRRFLDSIQMFCSLSAALLYSHFQPSKYLDCFHYLSYSIGTKWENTKCPLDHFCLLDASSFFHDLYFARLIMTFTHLSGLNRTGTLGKYATTYKCYHWPNLKALKFVLFHVFPNGRRFRNDHLFSFNWRGYHPDSSRDGPSSRHRGHVPWKSRTLQKGSSGHSSSRAGNSKTIALEW